MKRLFLVVSLIVFILVAGYIFYQTRTSDKNPVPVVTSTPTPEALVGNDADVHGCRMSAGFSWCEEKKKCIRPFEEDCLAWQAIKAAIVEKDKLPADIVVTVTKETPQYATGKIIIAEGEAGGIFLAAKVNDGWKIVYSGNGSIDCPSIKKSYEFPTEMLVNFCD